MAKAGASAGRRLVWRLEAAGYDALSGLLRLLPVDMASALGGWILRTLGPLIGEQRIAEMNLQLAFPDMPPRERRRILKAQWDNLGRTSVEFAFMDRIARDPARLEVIGAEGLLDMATQGQPMILFSGHLANWEAISAAGVRLGLRFWASYRPANNPYIDARIVEARRRYGLRLFAAKGGAGSRQLIRALRSGEALGMMNDQRDDNGVEAPFFGHAVRTAQGPSRLALHYGGKLIPVGVERLRGARFRVRVFPAIQLEGSADSEADLQRAVAQVNAFIEARVRERPEQYLWAHRRFPWAAYETLGYRRQPRKAGRR